MEINYFGHSCFRLRGKEVTIITDPYNPTFGLKLPKKLEANIVTVSHPHSDHNYTEVISGHPFVVAGPGEYEIGGVTISGILSFHDKKKGALRGPNTIYLIEIDELIIGHLGDLDHDLGDRDLENIGKVDVLLVPVGGNFTLGASEAVKIISEISPKIVIPMHYKIPGSKLEIDPLDKFCKEIGCSSESQDKLIINAQNLPEEKEKIVILAPTQYTKAKE